MSNITFKRERLEDCVHEMMPILLEHWEEIAMYKDKVPYDPDWDKYLALDDADILHVITARSNGVMVGYFVALVNYGLHYNSTKYAINDVLYVSKDFRGTSLAYRLFKFSEDYFKNLGVDVMTIHMKTYAPFDNLCVKLGYDYCERMYSKYIGD